MRIHNLSATELAAAIRARTVSCEEAVGSYLERIGRFNPALNAVVTLDAEGARKRAIEADRAMRRGEVWGPLHGVPITVKDTFETAGLRTTAGYPPFAHHVSGLTFSGPFNLTGHPVVVIPIGRTHEGLPVGAQLVGKRDGEIALLDAAEIIDGVLDQYRPPPGYED